MYPRLIRTQRIRPWFLYTPPVAICDGFHVELSGDEYFGQLRLLVKIEQYLESRRDRSRNKVAVGEPAAGSFMMLITPCRQHLDDKTTIRRRLPDFSLSGSAFAMIDPRHGGKDHRAFSRLEKSSFLLARAVTLRRFPHSTTKRSGIPRSGR